MTWRSYVDHARDTIHMMPETDPPHEYTDCWCRPHEAMVVDGTRVLLLMSHRDGEDD